MSAFADLLDFPEAPLPQPNFDAVETRHIEMASHDVDCPASTRYEAQCVCKPITYINGQPVYHCLPPEPRNMDWEDETPTRHLMDYTERMEMSMR